MPDTFTLLLEWRRNEAAGRSLAKLPPDYYPTVAQYLSELRRSYEADLRENPSSRKGEISRQTYHRATQVARDVLEGRMQKVLSLAFQASIGGSRDLPNALAEEKAMFDQLLGTFQTLRRTAAPYLEVAGGPLPAVSPSVVASRPPAPGAGPNAGAPATDATPTRSPAGPLTYVRVVKDGRPLSIGAETVDLRTDDLLSIPPETAKILVDGKVAEPISARPLGPRA